jgi:glucose/arabinose dehydrogenase
VRRLVTALAAVVLLASCTDDEPASDAAASTTETTVAESTTTTEPLAVGSLDAIDLRLELVAELDEPIALAARPGSPDLYIAEKGGRVRLIEVEDDDDNTGTTETTETTEPPDEPDDGKVDTSKYREQRTPLLDISDEVINEGERGLLGMTFSSDGRKLYLDYTRQPDGATVVVEYTLGDSKRIDKATRREILEVEQPLDTHNGGQLVIGPDGYLYIALGDGGDGDPSANAQDTSTLLGSILRIDPEAGSEDGPAYGIPPGNPFAEGEDGKPEIWLYGVRNPWRFTFDTLTGDLWVGDVGEDAYEEIDLLPAVGGFDAGRGDNLGWNEMEGTHPFDGGENPPGGVLPLFEYGRDQGCSVIGGYVYRGEEIPDLEGTYLYADFCGTGLRGLQIDRGTIIDEREWAVNAAEPHSLGQGDDGEVYLLLAGGQVWKVVA